MNDTRFHLFAIDAPSKNALLQRVKRLIALLHGYPDTEFEYICTGLARQRARSAKRECAETLCRLAVVASNAEQAITMLQRYIDGDNNGVSISDQDGHIALYCRRTDTHEISVRHRQPPLCLLLADISTGWWANDWLVSNSDPWLCGLLDGELSRTAEFLQANHLPDPRPLLSMSSSTVETASAEGTLSTKAQHSALYAFQTAAIALLHSLGIKANTGYQAVASFSMGEPGGAVAAGELSIEQGAAVMAAMSEVVEQLERRGNNGMMAIKGLSETELERICLSPPLVETDAPLQVEVGAYLQEGLGTLTGDKASLSILEKYLALKDSDYWANSKITMLKHSRQSRVAYHSSYFEPYRDAFVRKLQPVLKKRIESGLPVRYWYSSVSGGLVGSPTHWRGVMQRSDICNPANDALFWYRSLRERASTFRALRAVVRDGYRIFLEVNTQRRFSQWAENMVHELDKQYPEEYPYQPSGVFGRALWNNENEDSCMKHILATVADIWVRGCELDWSAAAYRSDPQSLDGFCQNSSLWQAIEAELSPHV